MIIALTLCLVLSKSLRNNNVTKPQRNVIIDKMWLYDRKVAKFTIVMESISWLVQLKWKNRKMEAGLSIE